MLRRIFNIFEFRRVIIDAPHVPLNNTLNKLIDKFDKFLSMFSRIFPLEMYICLSKE